MVFDTAQLIFADSLGFFCRGAFLLELGDRGEDKGELW